MLRISIKNKPRKLNEYIFELKAKQNRICAIYQQKAFTGNIHPIEIYVEFLIFKTKINKIKWKVKQMLVD